MIPSPFIARTEKRYSSFGVRSNGRRKVAEPAAAGTERVPTNVSRSADFLTIDMLSRRTRRFDLLV